ncbi:hypothetical protein ENUP19_0130G0035 [Entamoeba nuttalli]|uniref:Zinc finger protein, putative n=2 Tax=Entamoeba nuttalli TaxID=412467 RepID=K2GF66_ENTNP|nr:zinc finger protein, putative [Entamoeba nuttalli P19]EKE41276.1 zinc finger protein, putative [Entamoeba nuttalli P19]|eukprot:XP_008856384.1 zinc finger protein, putative [Entamoeba nuttalli P19]
MSSSQETLDIGTKCLGCGLMDFLPIKCSYCHSPFCNKCIKTHQCDKAREELQKEKGSIQCPICQKYIQLGKGDIPDVVINKHIENNCRLEPKKEGFICNLCGKTELVEIVCAGCHKNYCVEHRNQSTHHCVALTHKTQTCNKSSPFSLTNFVLEKSSLFKSQKSYPTQPVNKQTLSAQKKAFILKNALGNKTVPFNCRLYFEVILPNEQRKALWINKNWTCGKVIDVICTEFGLPNTNLVNSPKYGLVDENGEQLNTTMAMSKLTNFSTIILFLMKAED